MTIINGKLKLRVGVQNHHGLRDKIVDLVENRLGRQHSLPIQFFFRNMYMESIDLSFDEEYVDCAVIPFNYITRERFSNEVQMDYEVRRDLSTMFRDLLPERFEGVYGLEFNNDYDYYSDPPDYESPDCHMDYDSDGYLYGEDNFRGCRRNSMPRHTPPPVEELAVIEKTNSTRKVFILTDEGD